MLLRIYGMQCPGRRAGVLESGDTPAFKASEGRSGAGRILFIGIVILIACALMAGAVSAEDKTAFDWNDLVANLTGNNNVTLTGDITVPSGFFAADNGIKIGDGNSSVLNLAGHTITSPGDVSQKSGNDRWKYAIFNLTGGSLTIKNNGVIQSPWTAIAVNKGTLTVEDGTIKKIPNSSGVMLQGYTIAIEGSSDSSATTYSTVKLLSGATVEGYGWAVGIGQSGTQKYGITLDVSGTLKGNKTAANANLPNGKASGGVTINGQVGLASLGDTSYYPKVFIRSGANISGFTGNDPADVDAPAVYGAGYGNWNIEDGATITGDEALSIKAGKWTIDGGTFTGTGKYDSAKPNTNGPEATGAVISVTNTYTDSVEMTINGGTFTSTNGYAFYDGRSDVSKDSALKSIAITGGTFTSAKGKKVIVLDPTPDTKSVSITGGTFVVHSKEGLKNALELGGTDYTVKLGETISYGEYNKTSRINMEKAGTPTLDLNGKEITASPAPTSDSNFGSSFIKINESVTLTVKDSGPGGRITVTDASPSIDELQNKPYIFFVAKKGVLNITSGTFDSPAGFVVGGNGYQTSSAGGIYAYPEIIIHGGTLTAGKTAIYMPAYGGKLTITGGTVTGVTGGIDIRTGTVNISGGTISSTGSNVISPANVTGHPLCDGSAIVLESSRAYETNITLKISDNAVIRSESGAAVRNFVRGIDVVDSKTASVTVNISGNATLSGNTAAIENAHYSNDQVSTIVGTFNLNYGYYKATSGILLKDVTPTYSANHVMSDTPVKDGYYGIIAVKQVNTPSGTVDTSNGTITVTGGTTAGQVDDYVANITTTGGSGGVTVNLTLTYVGGVNVSGTTITPNISGEIPIVEMIYSPVDVEGVTQGSLLLIVDGGNPAGTDNLSNILNGTAIPRISTEKNEEAVSKLPSTVEYLTMITVDHTNYSKQVGPLTLTLTFNISESDLSGKDFRKIFVYHIDKDGKVTKIPTTQTKNGPWYMFTAIIEMSSPIVLGCEHGGSPGPGPHPVYSSSDGNMENAFRVLFDSKGGSFVQPVTYLSYGDRVPKPADPERPGYIFGGWYKDEECTIAWIFGEDAVPGDMTLYAKWISPGSAVSGGVEPTKSAAAQSTTVPTTASATKSMTASVTTPTSISPTMTQAPAPLFGMFAGLVVAGALLRRRSL